MGLLLSIPIGLFYNLVISKISNIITKDSSQKDKLQQSLVINIIGGIFAIVMAYFIFGSKKMENNIAKYGLLFGGAILLFYSVICNWDNIEDGTKLFALFGIMIYIILHSYKYIKKNK